MITKAKIISFSFLSILMISFPLCTFNIISQNYYSSSCDTSPVKTSAILISSNENESLLAHNMDVKINNDFSLKIISTFVLVNNDSQPKNFFAIEIYENISSVFSYDPLGSLIFSWLINVSTGSLINVTLRHPLQTDELYTFSISYRIDNIIYFVEKPVEYYGLEFEIIFARDTEVFNLIISLPLYGSLLDKTPPDPIYPHADRIYEEDEIIKINWVLENVQINEYDLFIVRFNTNPSYVFAASKYLPLYYVLTFLGGASITILIFFLFLKLRYKPRASELVTSLLSKTEQEVIKAINIDGGVSTQRKICEKTGYSKSKVSQILLKLEKRNVLLRERWGRTNKVTIINPTFKTLGLPELKTLEKKE